MTPAPRPLVRVPASHSARRDPHGLAALALPMAAVVSLLLSPAAARAQEDTRHTSVRFDVHLDVGWYKDIGAGFRIDIPIVPEGLLLEANDDLSLSLGAEIFWFYGASDGLGVFPIIALQWNFYVGDRWSVFPELGAALLFAPNRNRFWRTFIAPFVGLGARYHFNERNALLLRVNWPAGLQIGLTF